MEKVILITGASSGIGKACAEHLSRKGHKVYGTSRKPIQGNHGFEMLQLDVTNPDSVQQAIKSVIEKEGHIDVVLNNAGHSMAGAIENFSEEEMHLDMEVFFFGMVRIMKAVLPYMREQNSGLIINISSIAGLMGIPFQGFYSASKFALEGLCESLRMELKPYNIHIVLLNPSDFLTGVSAHRYFPAAANTPNAYLEQFKISLGKIEQDESKGSNPAILAHKVEKIINCRKPAFRYIIGRFDQKLAVLIKIIIPARWFKWILEDHYKVR